MSTTTENRVIGFDQVRKHSERLKKNRRISEIQTRFEKAMGWEKKEPAKKEPPVKGRKRQRR